MARGDYIVFFDAPAAGAEDLIGRIVPVRIDRADRLSLHGVRVSAQAHARAGSLVASWYTRTKRR